MRRRWLPASALVASVALVSCFELSAPQSGVSAVSRIMKAWPSVVVGDTLRDSLGNATALRVDAFDGDGNLIEDADLRFIALDTGLSVSAQGFVVGTRIRTLPARVVAQVSHGGGVLQTAEDSIDVVPTPDSVLPNGDTTFAAKLFEITNPAVVTSDPVAVTILSRATGVAAGVPVRSWVVGYEILAQPQGQNDQNTALFTGAGESRFAYDTTDANGVAGGRTIALQRSRLISVAEPQIVKVRATIRRIGSNSTIRTVTFTLPFIGQ